VKESVDVRQIPGEAKRRWFSSIEFDLIVWFANDQDITGFELCYDKTSRERSIRWSRTKGFSHMAVDDGEHRPGKHKEAPIMVLDGYFDAKRVCSSFLDESRSLPKEVTDFVLRTLEKYPDSQLAS